MNDAIERQEGSEAKVRGGSYVAATAALASAGLVVLGGAAADGEAPAAMGRWVGATTRWLEAAAVMAEVICSDAAEGLHRFGMISFAAMAVVSLAALAVRRMARRTSEAELHPCHLVASIGAGAALVGLMLGWKFVLAVGLGLIALAHIVCNVLEAWRAVR